MRFLTKLRASGCSSKSGTEAFIAAKPIINRANPIINCPIFLFLLFEDVVKMNPTATRGMAMVDMSILKPNREMIQAVTVVPILAPIITPIALARESNPAFTILTTITVVPLEDWIRAVMMIPVSTRLKRVEVIDSRKDLSLSPAAF